MAGLITLPAITARAADYTVGDWTLSVGEETPAVNLSYKGKALFNDLYATVVYNRVGSDTDVTISNLGKTGLTVTEGTADATFGAGSSVALSLTEDGVTMTQTFNFYDDKPFMIVQAAIEALDGGELQSRSLTALAINASSNPLNGANNRMVWVPFDNDGHLKYEVNRLTNSEPMTSHEVGYVFDGDSRLGLIGGSVDHDNWKSGVTIAGSNGFKLEKFELLSGLTNYFTRDALPHGKVKGTRVASARFFVGLYDDWRQGLNEFADANTMVVPRAEWNGGTPMGWSSWGVQMNYITYQGVLDCASFIKNELYDLGFHQNDGRTVISLDSFAEDNISQAQLYTMGTKIFGEGPYRDGRETKQGSNQILGQYCGPLVVWDWTLDSQVQGTGVGGSPTYTNRDIALKVNGNVYKMPSNGGLAVDPTHPGVKACMENFMARYARNGAKYVKADFLNNGIIEGDSWYDPNITTGVQAYNYGMKMFHELAERYGMYVVESISPIFPYQYGHGRRTCCDRFSEIGETEYVMNSISYGWWTDRLYTVNDPDQLVLCKGGHNAQETLGENRARATSGMTVGAFIFGDNFSENVVYTDSNDGHTQGQVVGYPEESRTRALQIMGNADINDYVRNNTGSFMPVYGNNYTSSQNAERVFMRSLPGVVYVAVFNYSRVMSSNGTVEFDRIGVNPADVKNIKELWSGEAVTPEADGIKYLVPAKDVKVYRITLNDGAGVEETVADEVAGATLMHLGAGVFSLTSGKTMAAAEAYDLAGRRVASVDCKGNYAAEIDLSACNSGVYMVTARYTDGTAETIKTVKR